MIKFKRGRGVCSISTNRLKAKDSGKMRASSKDDPIASSLLAMSSSLHWVERSHGLLMWVEWLLSLISSWLKSEPISHFLTQARHQVVPVQTKYVKDVVWIIWELSAEHQDERGRSNSLLHITDALVELFCFQV
jgi:hypothetical protein